MDGTIDRIQIELSANATRAQGAITTLVRSLSSLEGAVPGAKTQLKSLGDALRGVSEAASGLSGLKALTGFSLSPSAARNLRELATVLEFIPADVSSRIASLSGLSSLSKVTVPKSLATNLRQMAVAVAEIPADAGAGVRNLANAMAPLSAMNGKSVSAAVRSLKALPAALKEFSSLDMGALAAQFKAFNDQLTPLTRNLSRLATAWQKLPPSMRSASSIARQVTSANRQLSASAQQAAAATSQMGAAATGAAGRMSAMRSSLSGIAGSVRSLLTRFMGFTAAMTFGKNAIMGFLNESNTFIENMNLFDASMGDAAQSARDFGNEVQRLMGIDFGQWARNQGVFQTLLTGMGETSERASVMSQQLTQLGYDISSFYNLDVSEAMLKLQSGIAGELEPLRRIGWDLSNTRMNLELTRLGIDATVQEMTQAEKVGLRYQLIMNQVTQTHGDMARTIASPANQLRVFQAQITLTKRAIGNLLIPALNSILPVLIAVVKAVRLAAEALARFFGWDKTFEVDYSTLDTSGIVSGADETADALQDVGDAADSTNEKVKELKNTVMGFDELNKLQDATTGSSSSPKTKGTDDASGIGLKLPLDTYDFMEGLTDHIAEKTDAMAKKIYEWAKKILPIATAIAGAFALWKLGKRIFGDLGALESAIAGSSRSVGNFQDKLRKTAGLTLAIAGQAVTVYSAFNAWNKGIDWKNLTGMLGGIGATVGGLALAFGKKGAIAGAILGTIELTVVGLHDIYENGMKIQNVVPVMGAFAGTGALIGSEFGPLGALIGGLIGLATGGIATVMTDLSRASHETVDVFQGVSDATREAFGTSMDSVQQLKQEIDKLNMSDGILGEEDVEKIHQTSQDIHDTILDNLDAKRNQELADIDMLSGLVKEETLARMRQSSDEFYDGMKVSTENAYAEINAIVAQAYAENRSLTEEENQRIEELQEQLYQNLLDTVQGSTAEMETIKRLAENNDRQAALDAANDVISTAGKQRDELVAAAKNTCDEQIAAAQRALKAGDIYEEEYQTIVDAAQNQRDESIRLADEAFSGVQQKVREQLGETAEYIDMESGRIISKIEFILGKLGMFNEQRAVIGANLSGNYNYWMGAGAGYIGGFAEGGLIRSGQLFMARENGIPEYVGSFGNQTGVANNDQIVAGIQQGVTSAMIQALLSVGTAGQGDGRAIEVPLIVSGEELARAVFRGRDSLERRGELTPQFA